MKSKIKILSSSLGYNLVAKDYDKKEKYLNSFEQFRVLPSVGNPKGLKILDVGAGTGRLSLEFSKRGADVVALDVSEEMLKILSQKDRSIKTVVGDAENLPFLDGEFDVVVSAFLVVHLKNLEVFFDEVYRVLKTDGKFLITNINQKEAPELKTSKGNIKIKSYYHRPEKVREIIEKLAFKIESEVFVKEKGVWINQILIGKK